MCTKIMFKKSQQDIHRVSGNVSIYRTQLNLVWKTAGYEMRFPDMQYYIPFM